MKTMKMLLALALCMMLGCTAMADGFTYADTIAWDGEYDVVVAGFGFAGATASVSAADAGASVLMVDKAPEGKQGGNSRVCGQMFVYGAEDEEATYTYYKQLAGDMDTPEAMLKLYTKQVAHMYDFVAELTGLDKGNFVNVKDHPRFGYMSPEYPEFEGADKISLTGISENDIANGALYNNMVGQVTKRADKIDVWFETPAVKLIQDPQSKTILGVTVEREGKALNIRAKNGVVLATGGFENNPEMVEDYLGLGKSGYFGGGYNTGDGITMAMEVGADLWHMEAYEGYIFALYNEEHNQSVSGPSAPMLTGSAIVVGANGDRFLREDETAMARHGHLSYGGVWKNPSCPVDFYSVMDADNYAAAVEAGLDPNFEYTYTGATLEEMAAAAGIDAEGLKTTIEGFNMFAELGVDYAFDRPAATMEAFGEGPYYAVKLKTMVFNTQGGPRRNENAEVLNVHGEPIPHLYSAGELGGITAFQYQGGGNVAECLIFGKIAGENAAAAKAELPAYVAVPVESNVVYTLGVDNDLLAEEAAYETAENQAVGTGSGMGGDVVVRVTFDGEKITGVEVLKQAETAGLGDVALTAVADAIVAANGTEVDNVSGATISSKAMKAAVEEAMSKR